MATAEDVDQGDAPPPGAAESLPRRLGLCGPVTDQEGASGWRLFTGPIA